MPRALLLWLSGASLFAFVHEQAEACTAPSCKDDDSIGEVSLLQTKMTFQLEATDEGREVFVGAFAANSGRHGLDEDRRVDLRSMSDSELTEHVERQFPSWAAENMAGFNPVTNPLLLSKPTFKGATDVLEQEAAMASLAYAIGTRDVEAARKAARTLALKNADIAADITEFGEQLQRETRRVLQREVEAAKGPHSSDRHEFALLSIANVTNESDSEEPIMKSERWTGMKELLDGLADSVRNGDVQEAQAFAEALANRGEPIKVRKATEVKYPKSCRACLWGLQAFLGESASKIMCSWNQPKVPWVTPPYPCHECKEQLRVNCEFRDATTTLRNGTDCQKGDRMLHVESIEGFRPGDNFVIRDTAKAGGVEETGVIIGFDTVAFLLKKPLMFGHAFATSEITKMRPDDQRFEAPLMRMNTEYHESVKACTIDAECPLGTRCGNKSSLCEAQCTKYYIYSHLGFWDGAERVKNGDHSIYACAHMCDSDESCSAFNMKGEGRSDGAGECYIYRVVGKKHISTDSLNLACQKACKRNGDCPRRQKCMLDDAGKGTCEIERLCPMNFMLSHRGYWDGAVRHPMGDRSTQHCADQCTMDPTCSAFSFYDEGKPSYAGDCYTYRVTGKKHLSNTPANVACAKACDSNDGIHKCPKGTKCNLHTGGCEVDEMTACAEGFQLSHYGYWDHNELAKANAENIQVCADICKGKGSACVAFNFWDQDREGLRGDCYIYRVIPESYSSKHKSLYPTNVACRKEQYIMLPTGQIECPVGLSIGTAGECQGAWKHLKATYGIITDREMVLDQSTTVPTKCSISYADPNDDQAPHWNANAHTDNSLVANGQYRVVCWKNGDGDATGSVKLYNALMPNGTTSCPPGGEIRSKAECQKAYTEVGSESLWNLASSESLQSGAWSAVPMYCSVKMWGGERTPYWNINGLTTSSRAASGEFRLICKVQRSKYNKLLPAGAVPIPA